MATLQERIAALRATAQAKRTAEGRTSIADQRRAAEQSASDQLRASKVGGISRKGGVVTESRGQRLFREGGGTTEFSSGGQFAGGKSSEFVGAGPGSGFKGTFGEEIIKPTGSPSAPKKGEIRRIFGESREDFQQRQASFKATQENIKATLGGAEEVASSDRQDKFSKDKAEELKAKKALNPEFERLTDIQKEINSQKPLDQQIKQFIGDDSAQGAPLSQTRERDEIASVNTLNNITAAAQASGTDLSALDVDSLIAQGVMKTTAQNFVDYQQKQASLEKLSEADKEAADAIKDEEEMINKTLGIQDGDELTFDTDGTPLINGKTEEEDAEARGVEKLERNRQRGLTDANRAHSLNMENIRAAYTVDGKMSTQGARVLAEAQRKYDQNITRFNEDTDDNKEDFIRAAQKNTSAVKAANKKANSPDAVLKRAISRERAIEVFAMQNEYAAKGIDKSFKAVAKEWDDLQNIPVSKQKMNAMNEQWASPQFDMNTSFGTALSILGSSKEAQKWMESKVIPESEIERQLQEYQKDVLGFSEEQVMEKKKDRSLNKQLEDAFSGNLSEEGLFDLHSELEVLEAENPKKAARIMFKLDNPDATPADIILNQQNLFPTSAERRRKEKSKSAVDAPKKEEIAGEFIDGKFFGEGSIELQDREQSLDVSNMTVDDFTDEQLANLTDEQQIIVEENSK